MAIVDRNDIINLFIELLTGTTDCGSNVYNNAVLPFTSSTPTPWLAIYMLSEETEQRSLQQPIFHHTLTLATEIVISAVDGTGSLNSPMTQLNTISTQIKNIILTNVSSFVDFRITEINSHIPWGELSKGDKAHVIEQTAWKIAYDTKPVRLATSTLSKIDVTATYEDITYTKEYDLNS